MPHQVGRWWIDHISQAVPGLNDRILGLNDLHIACLSKGFFAGETPMRRLHGCAFINSKGQPSLVINSLLKEPEKIVAGWHEFSHLMLHAMNESVFCSTGNLWRHSKTERQAQTVGVIALLPQKMLGEDLSDYPAKIVKYRWQIWQEFGL